MWGQVKYCNDEGLCVQNHEFRPVLHIHNYTSQDSSAPAGVVAFESLVVEGLGEKGAGVSLRQENIPPFHSSFLYLLLFQILNTGIQYGI